MKVVTGNLWDEVGHADLILVTTNAALRKDGSLIMGAGAARQASDAYPDLSLFMGEALQEYKVRPYGVITGYFEPDITTEFGIFQTKNHWAKISDPQIIAYSVQCLCAIADEYGTIALNFPGIGYGKMNYDVALDLIQPLPENVTIYQR